MTLAGRLLPALALSAIVVAGCGGGGDSGAGPLDNALGYLPADTPLVISVDTDVAGKQFKAVGAIAGKFPFGNAIANRLKSQIEDGGVSFNKDIKPLLGNEIVIGATDASDLVDRQSGDESEFVAAIQTKDGDKLKKLIEKGEGVAKGGEKGGVTFYRGTNGAAAAVKGDVLVIANSRNRLDAAIKQRDGDARLTEGKFNGGLTGLPGNALVKVYGDLEKLLKADPSTARARRVSWVDALRTFGTTLSFRDNAVDVDFRLNTDGSDLSDQDLPIAPGDASPPVLDTPLEIGVGLRNPAQLIAFSEAAAQAAAPGAYSQYSTAKATLERQLGIDIENDVLSQLKDDASISIEPRTGQVGARIKLADAGAARETLGKIEDRLGRISGSGARATKVGGVTYIRGSGGGALAYKIAGDALIVANSPRRVQALAAQSPGAVAAARGSVTLKADAQQLLSQALRSGAVPGVGGLGGLGGGGLGSLGSSLFTSPLGDLTGSARATKDGISGRLRLTFD